MTRPQQHWWRIAMLPLLAAVGLVLLGAVTAEQRARQRAQYEAKLTNTMLGRAANAAPAWRAGAPLAAYPHMSRLEIADATLPVGEIWLGWRQHGGYAGPIELAIAFDRRSRVRDVRLLQHSETPGLGDRLERRNSDWLTQFHGIAAPDMAALRTRGGQIDAMAGATITSAAISSGVQSALRVYRQQGASRHD